MLVAVGGLLLGGLAIGLFAAAQIPDYAGPCGRDEAPSSKRHAVDPVEYEHANLELARGIAQFASSEITEVSSRSLYRCSPTVTSDVVRVTTSFSANLHNSSKCAYMNSLEADLRSVGWVVHSVETAALDGKGQVRFTTAERGHQYIEISIDGLGTQVHVTVDHDTGQNGSLSPDFPTSVCE